MKSKLLRPKNRNRYRRRLKPVTICIGAICDKGKKAIAVSDRMLSWADVEFEQEIPKIEKLSDNCIALSAGPALASTDLFRNVRRKIGTSSPPISIIQEMVKAEYSRIRKAKLEENLFNPRGFTMEWFYQNQQRLDENIILRLDNEVEQYDLELLLIVAGVDTTDAHLYQVANPGSSDCFDSLGFLNIGIGSRHASMTYIDERYTPRVSLNEALYISYKAKKRAEIAPGVGDDVDITILDGSVKYLTRKCIGQLQSIYENEVQHGFKEEINKLISELKIEVCESAYPEE